MSVHIRVFQSLNLDEIKKHLMVIGDVSAMCENCRKLDVKTESPICPECKTEFKFVAFRSSKVPMAKVTKLTAQRPSMKIIDFEDYTRVKGSSKLDDLFK